MSPPLKTIQTFLFTTGRAPLKDRRPVGLAFMRELSFAKKPPSISVNIPKLLMCGNGICGSKKASVPF